MTHRLFSLYRLDEMARSREEAMWTVLDWAATQPGEFTIKDLHRKWVEAGGGGDNASYQQFSTAINNYIYKFDPQSPIAKYRNPRYKYIRIGKTDKGTVPAPLQYVTRGHRGSGAQHVLRWRPGIAPMRQPSAPKAPIHSEGDPVGDALDRLERKMGRPALKAAIQRWKQLGDLHKIGADIMADVGIKGRDKMLALQVAADGLVAKGKATQAQADQAEDEMGAEADGPATPFKASEPEETGFEDDADQKTDPDATPLGSQVGGDGPDSTDDADVPDDLLHGDEPGDADETSDGGGSEEPTTPDEPEEQDGPVEDDETMRGTLVGTEEGGNEGQRIPVVITYDEDDGAAVSREGGDPIGPYEGFNLEVANGVLTQDAFDDLEEDGWNLVAAEEAQADDSADDADEGDDGDDDPDDSESEEGDGPVQASSDSDDAGEVEASEYPAYVPEPDERGDRAERAMFELVSEGDLREDDPLWEQLRNARDSVDAHRIIKASSLPHGLHRYALVVARAIFDNTGRDFDSGSKRNESRLASLYGIIESPLQEPLDFNQESGLKRVFKWASRSE